MSRLAGCPDSYGASLRQLYVPYLTLTTVCVVGTSTITSILRIRKLRHGKVKNAFRAVFLVTACTPTRVVFRNLYSHLTLL